MSQTSQERDPAWNYCIKPDEKNRDKIMCNFCQSVKNGGISRMKQHFLGGYRNTTACPNIPADVKEIIRKFMEKKKARKESSNFSNSQTTPHFDDVNFGESEEEECMEVNNMARGKGKSVQSQVPSKRSRTLRAIDAYYAPTGSSDASRSKTVGKKKQQTVVHAMRSEALKKHLRDDAVMKFANWMYGAGIPFNAVQHPDLQPALEAVGVYGPDLKKPSYHEVRVTCLKKSVELIKNSLKANEEQWAKIGCSIMCDGWKDTRERCLINFLVNSPMGSVFVESIDASDYAKTGEKMCELLRGFIDRIGVKNVVQVVTDSASNNVFAGKMLMLYYPNLFWTPCGAHCLDLMLEDIGKIPKCHRTISRAIKVTSYIYTRPGMVNMMRRFTGYQELLRPAKTRFATAFITLSAFWRLKTNLKQLFTSNDWVMSKYVKEAAGKQAKNIVLMPTFWNSVRFCIKATGPLVKVLRLVDGEKQPAMGYIYEAMDRAKEAIQASFQLDDPKLQNLFQIIDNRWDVQLHQPLHAAGYFLNLEFFYKDPNIESNAEIRNGLMKCIERLIPDSKTQQEVVKELMVYTRAEGQFGTSLCKKMRTTTSPAAWWESFRHCAPHLKTFAIRVLSLCCSASGCERNWSIFQHLHSKRRNKLEQSRLNDLVYVKYNQQIRRRYDLRMTIDPISLIDIDESNEWLIGRMEGDIDDGDEIVFGEDGLTWDVIATAMGIGERRYESRNRASTNQDRGHLLKLI